jgi:hypothetical protein
MVVAPYVLFPCLSFPESATFMRELRADARRNECERALPELSPGFHIHVDDVAGASGETSGGACRMGWTRSRRQGSVTSLRNTRDLGDCGYASDVAGEPAVSVEPDRPGAEVAKCR